MKFTVDNKTSLFYFLAITLLITVLVTFYLSNQQAKKTGYLVEHSLEVLSKSDKILMDVLNMETSFRGYILTGNKTFRTSYQSSSGLIISDLSELAELIHDNPSQRNKVDSLTKVAVARMVFALKNINVKEQNLWEDQYNAEIIEHGKTLTDDIRRWVEEIKLEESSLLRLRKDGNDRSIKNSDFIFMLLLGSLVAIFILIIIILRSHKNRNKVLLEYAASQKLFSNYSLSLIEASLDPLVTISAGGKITDMNEALVLMTGMSREELRGTDFFNYFTDTQKAREVYEEVFAKGFVADSPLTLRNKNSNLTDVLFNGSVYKDDQGNVLGIVIVARDVAEKKWVKELQLANRELGFQNDEKEKRAAELLLANQELIFQNEEKEKRAAELILANKELIVQNVEKEKRAAELAISDKELLWQIRENEKQEIANIELEAISDNLKSASQYSRSLIEVSLDPLVTINAEGKITDMNEALVLITGLSRQELKGTDFFHYFTELENAREVYKEVFAKGSVINSPLTIRHKDGKLTDVLFNGSVYKDEQGKVLGVVVVARDITDQKRIASELMEAIVFAELAVAIAEEAKIKAESATLIAETAVKAKQQFLSNMSHEIRTPMNAIIGFTKVLLKTDTSTKQKEYLQAIKMSGDALIVLINDILDLAKVDAGKMIFERTPFRMALSISAMLHLFEPKIREKNLELVKEYDSNIPAVLLGDSVRLHQIILNLVSNAVKFTNKGKITVSVHLLKENEREATIGFSVKDTGIGIPENKIGRIFENFQQASSGTSRLYGGTGLGLAIVKQLVEAQDGTISVESKVAIGSSFGFILTFQKTKAEAESDHESMELDTDVKNVKVLVVEDIALNQLLMKTLLDEFGFYCDIASNGLIAIELLRKNSYDIVLMDLQMPEMNGFEATNYIRNTLHSSIPIVALTADVTTVDLAKCKSVGMNDYIAKPVDEKLLYSKIVSSVKKPLTKEESIDDSLNKVIKYTDLTYLIQRTKSNPILMMEMISLYLEQTPPLISAMKQSWKEKEWSLLYAAVHKIIPSFAIMGISPDFEEMAKKIQDYAKNQQQSDGISDMVQEIEYVCVHACEELEIEFNVIKNAKK